MAKNFSDFYRFLAAFSDFLRVRRDAFSASRSSPHPRLPFSVLTDLCVSRCMYLNVFFTFVPCGVYNVYFFLYF